MGKSVKEGIMPKEFIHSRDFGRTVVLDDGSGSVSTAELDRDAIKVGWSKESEHVELAVLQSIDGAFVEHGFAAEIGLAEGDPAAVLRLAELTPRYIQLDRAGINRLITTLRQARDDAFGRDA